MFAKIKKLSLIFLPYIILLVLFGCLNQVLNIDPFYNGDAMGYHKIAENLVAGNGYSLDGVSPSIHRPPAFIWLLAAFYHIFGVLPQLVVVINLLALLLALYFLQKLAVLYLKKQPQVLTVLLLFSFYLPNYLYAYQIRVESLMLFLMLATLYYFSVDKRLPAVVFLALLILTKGIFILLPLLFFLPLLLPLSLQSVKHFLTKVGFIYLIVFILLAPWMARNYHYFGKPIYSSVGMGDVLYPGNNLKYNGDWQGDDDPYFKEVHLNNNEVVAEKILVATAIKSIKKYPLPTLNLWLKKSWRFWQAPIGFDSLNKGVTKIPAYFWYYFHFFLLAAALRGLYLWRHHRWQWPLVCFIFGYYGLHIVLYAIPRYHYPLMPLLFIYVAVALFKDFKLTNDN